MQIEDDAGPRWRWWRILFAALAVPIADLLVITLVVTVYAFKLAFKAQGAPDQARITQFAAQFGRSSWPLIAAVLTILAAVWVARQARHAERRHGAAVGIIAGIITTVPGLTLNMQTLGDFGLIVAAGLLGGLLVARLNVSRS